jgi:4-amino-4-deoxy-L-arabinose transferase-like glycosyltransferase
VSSKKPKRRREAKKQGEATVSREVPTSPGWHGPGHGAPALLEDPRYYWLLVGICFGAAVIFRLAFLSADPPWSFTWSQALFTDGARAIDGARSKIVFGQWIVDMRSPVVLFYPLVNVIALVIFKLGGVGLAQANLVGALPALGSIGVAYAWMRKVESKLAGLIVLAVLTFCYAHIVYSRVPLVESLLILMLFLSFWLAMRDKLGLFVAGLLIGMAAFMVKMHALHMIPVVAVYLLMDRASGEPSRSRVWTRILVLLAGMGVALGMWLALVYLVNPAIVSKYFQANILIAQKGEYAGASALEMIERRIGAFIHVGSGRDGFFAKVPIMSLAGFAGLICAASGLTRGKGSSRSWEKLTAIWFFGILAALSLLSYRPLRYFVLVIPSLALLATSFLMRLGRGESLFSAGKPRWFAFAFAVWLAWFLIHIQQDVLYRVLSGARASGGLTQSQMSLYRFQAAVWPKVLIFGGISAALTFVFRRRITSAKVVLPARAGKAIVLVILMGIALLNTVKFAQYVSDRKYSIVEGAESLDRVLSDGVFLVGDCSTTMSLENDFRSLPAYGDLIRYDEREDFEKYPITHFILRFPTLYEYLAKNYDNFNSRLSPVKTFVLCGRDATIVRYEAWPGYAQSGYVPSEYEVGMEMLRSGRFDEAKRTLDGFLVKHPDSYEALVGLAICRIQTGDRDGAFSSIERALELNRRDALSYEIYGDMLASVGRDLEARSQWERALKLNPNSRKLREKLGPRRR